MEVLEINKAGKFRIQHGEKTEVMLFEIIELDESVITFCLSRN